MGEPPKSVTKYGKTIKSSTQHFTYILLLLFAEVNTVLVILYVGIVFDVHTSLSFWLNWPFFLSYLCAYHLLFPTCKAKSMRSHHLKWLFG